MTTATFSALGACTVIAVSLDPFLERPPPPRRIVAHLDLDAFFASVEVRENPALRGLPVVVGGDPKGGTGRGIVTTASYEARKFGIRSALPIATAYRLCPHAVYLRPRHRLYSSVAKRVFAIVEDAVDVVERASIDEAYMDVTDRCDTFEDAARHLRGVSDAIQAAEGITASIGIAPNKLVAKIASDANKPNGITVVPPGDVEAFLAPLPASKIPGVGPKTADALAARGINTCHDLAALPREALVAMFGQWGPRLAAVARGEDHARVAPSWERKSLGAERTYMEDVTDPEKLARSVRSLAEDVADGLAREGIAARTITLKVRTQGFETFTRAKTVHEPVFSADDVHAIARDLFAANAPDAPVRLLGVRATGLTRRPAQQATMATWPAAEFGEDDAQWESRVKRWFA